MNPQLIIVQQHQARLRAEASNERLARTADRMPSGASRHLAVVTRIAAALRSFAGRQSVNANLSDTATH
jgi:hypothetical protein